jgi:anthranilate/para-aminobenzoate synthase component II
MLVVMMVMVPQRYHFLFEKTLTAPFFSCSSPSSLLRQPPMSLRQKKYYVFAVGFTPESHVS